MHVLLLAAGVGARLGPYTDARPKCLMEVGGMTLLERRAHHVAARVTVVVGHLAEMVDRAREEIEPAPPGI